MKQQNAILENQNRQLAEHGRMLEVLGKASLRGVLAEVDNTIQDRQLSMMETMEQLHDGKSIARWGDGEIRIMLQPEFELSFQKPNPKLALELERILATYDSIAHNTLLAFPTVFVSRMWMGIWAEMWHELRPILNLSSSPWGNTHISRPLFFQKHGSEAVDAWRKLWDGKNVAVIAGRGSRFALLPELFDNVGDIKLIESLPRDAFNEFDALKQRVQDAPQADLYLTALGPTGTALSAHLSSPEGGSNHAIDVGHLSSSYSTAFNGGKFPEDVPLISAT
ncbi:GT-D fold domain-containing glycosyltransferase [Glutamicibacter mishrai]|uniref:GT-D fold domain-containing glycosyltransferase n=1 Tax=Glutamicibacter mishrai TaxID=1775880 RepID=UPI0020CFBA4F|nr:GT-D fold domain-containing glycosyltransferase [Glutamicibacter mishrai]UTT41081.1 GT-D fold domain-containing glycosyltransferase [Glutamicibacter mishrai]